MYRNCVITVYVITISPSFARLSVKGRGKTRKNAAEEGRAQTRLRCLTDRLRGRVFAFPHPGSDLVLLFAKGVGIDSRDLKGGMAHPFFQHVRGYAARHSRNAVAVAQALGGLVRPVCDLRRVQYLFHPSPSGGA